MIIDKVEPSLEVLPVGTQQLSFDEVAKLSKHEIRAFIHNIENQMLQGPTVEVPLHEYYSKNVYAREISVPKGTLIVGKIHKYQNLHIVSKGEVSVLSIDGMARLKAPCTFVASAGAKRLIYAHEDTVWTTITGTDETDPEKIEEQFIAKTYDEVYLATARTFADVLESFGVSEVQLRKMTENESDQVMFPTGFDSVVVAPSPIEGNGLFAAKNFAAGDVIAPARIADMRTPAGRYTNHSATPNAKMVMHENGDVDLVAISDIESGTEIVSDYYFNFINSRR
jgi:hypothetical protein